MATAVDTRLDVYELDGEEPVGDIDFIISSHWNDDEKVVVSVGGKDYTLLARDVRVAIDNGTNR